MRKLVNSSWFIVNRHKKTINHQPSTINRNSTGFTLIELLIVIALIGILSSFGVYSFQSSQKKARDGQRKNDLQMVKKALEAAKNDCLSGSYYPQDTSQGFDSGQFLLLINHLKNESYLSQAVNDPKADLANNYYYGYGRGATLNNVCPLTVAGNTTLAYSGTKEFALRTKMEIPNDPENNDSKLKCDYLFSTSTVEFLNADPPAADDGYYYVCPD